MKNGFGYGDWFNHLEDGDEYTQTQCAAVEMLRNGYTCFLEPGTAFDPDAVAEAAEAVGVRGSVADPFLWDVPDGGNQLVAPMARRAPCGRSAPSVSWDGSSGATRTRAGGSGVTSRCTGPARNPRS